MLNNLSSVIFDLDGTIVDSKLNFSLMKEEIGMPQDESILEYLDTIDDKKFLTKAFEIIHKHELEGAHQSTLIRDFQNFYDFLKEKAIPIGVLTRNSKEITDLTISKHNLHIDKVLTRDCCKAKPDPEGLYIILEDFKTPKENSIYIGDFLFDLQTAKNAGISSGLILNDKNSVFKNQASISFEFYNELKKFF